MNEWNARMHNQKALRHFSPDLKLESHSTTERQNPSVRTSRNILLADHMECQQAPL